MLERVWIQMEGVSRILEKLEEGSIIRIYCLKKIILRLESWLSG